MTASQICASGSVVEHLLAKEGVAGSSPVSRSLIRKGHSEECPFSYSEPEAGSVPTLFTKKNVHKMRCFILYILVIISIEYGF